MTTHEAEGVKSLLPCPNPWCDASTTPVPLRGGAAGLWRIQCGCGVRTHREESKDAAIAAWNRRSPPSGEGEWAETRSLLERTAQWVEASIPRLTDPDSRADAARDVDALRALFCQPQTITLHGPITGGMAHSEVSALFAKYAGYQPPTILRDELVAFYVWARYGEKVAAALAPTRPAPAEIGMGEPVAWRYRPRTVKGGDEHRWSYGTKAEAHGWTHPERYEVEGLYLAALASTVLVEGEKGSSGAGLPAHASPLRSAAATESHNHTGDDNHEGT